MNKREKKYFNRALEKANKVVGDSKKIGQLLDDAYKKLESKSKALSKVADDLKSLMRLIRSYISGNYKDIPIKTILLAIASVFYFVWPLDALPDFIVGLGFIDDLSILTFVVKSIKGDIDRFTEWESNQQIISDN